MKHAVRLALALIVIYLAGCANPPPNGAAHVADVAKFVRMTAYTCTEAGGRHDACGGVLTTGSVHSAAADWSRYPVGTRFQIVETGELCEIDDYGSALVGTNTIDLYKDTRRDMRTWGVRMVHIRILIWGSPRRSLEILTPRSRNRCVRPMISALRQQTQGEPHRFHRIES
ncbi:MAG TPA: 3D domain-containing protein [Chthoniobacteraceae bacterium]|jgi:3D (Asp-Asp-Asp) domain-containing protein|nr:3D domain-containing protein [Chthoniobacteraceae bacterium]